MTSTPPRRIVVIGGGMAGARLVQQLAVLGPGVREADPPGSAAATEIAAGHAGGTTPRQRSSVREPQPVRVGTPLFQEGEDVKLTWIGEEPHPAYNRLLLAEVLADRYAPEVIELPRAADSCTIRRGVRAVRIDRAHQAVDCDNGERVGYDALVLATGSNPVLPPLRGLFEEGSHDLPSGVHAFRTLTDCLALARDTVPGGTAVVVGGGLLGVSAARALAARGVQVVLAHQGEHLMDRHLDAHAARLLREHLASAGVEVHTECRVRGVTTGPGRRVTAVELADGYLLETGTVVLACGVRPRTGLAFAAGLPVRRGIVVNDRLRTADPRIHAIGDCAEHRSTVYGLAGPAREQADVLARVLAGQDAAYNGTRALTRLTLNGPGTLDIAGSGTLDIAGPGTLDIASFGDPAPAPGDDVLRLADATRGAYRKVVVRGDRLVGGILLGDLATVGALARTWEDDEPLPSQPLHLLTSDGG